MNIVILGELIIRKNVLFYIRNIENIIKRKII
jgi:hypothetical protein